MALRIEDYALIGDTHTAALVGTNGSIDWLCVPRFDSAACFASLLGTGEHGFWDIAPAEEVREASRRYRGPTLVLETTFETAGGEARVIDCMPLRASHPRVVRVVEGVRGEGAVRTRFKPRFDYGGIRPWMRRHDGAVVATAGPEALELRSDVALEGHDFVHTGEFTPRGPAGRVRAHVSLHGKRRPTPSTRSWRS
jgi:GH15 family glucan-1,4-alpha-glucosidase